MTERDPIRDANSAMTDQGASKTNSAPLRVLVAVACYNEGVKIDRTLSRFPKERSYDIAVMDDGSTDDSVERIRKFPNVAIVSHPRNRGVGAALRTINQYALDHSYDVVINMAGNDKDDPLLIPKLLQPMVEEGCDYVQGSRYLKGGGYGNMPLYRIFATRVVHPLLFSLITGNRITDSTNGFRAYRTSLLRDQRIDLNQDWLDKYELEPYFFYKTITLGYKVKEVPVTKIYPPHELGYTKMKPITGWWSILRPIVLLGLRIRK
ncbi:MAG TPA: glycosyltransferase family 2 protein [Verrucomicrobiae bacterium]|nr:glycosyltransferase family 2 protein [Verrucomicrobiae bacterium]